MIEIEGNCDHCGRPYVTSYRRTKYCSPICRARAFKARQPPKPRGPRRRGWCDYCGAAYETARPQQKFCSAAHRRAFNRIVDSNARPAMRAVRESVRQILRMRQST